VPNDWYHLLDPFLNSSGTVCWNDNIRLGFLSYLLGLQAIMVLWSTFIIRVAVRFLQGNSAEDIRSDGEDDGEEEEVVEKEDKPTEAQPIEEEVSVESIDLKGWRRRNAGQRVRGSTGVSVRGRSGREEILNRIGCETKID
jgi:acyl-CoA-dependent ceramide synthase